MTIPQSLETLRFHVRNLKIIDDNTFVKDPVSGEVKPKKRYTGTIDAMQVAIDCMERYTTRPTGAPDPRTDSSMTMQESIEVLRRFLRCSEACITDLKRDSLYQAVKAVLPMVEKASADAPRDPEAADPEAAVAMLRCLLSYHERVTMHDSGECGGLRCYSDALRLGIRCIEKTYGLSESDNPAQ